MNKITRWKHKYHKLSNFSPISRIYGLINYIFVDLANIFLLKITDTKKIINTKSCRNILFIEPQKQGFGDLIFQTPVFRRIGKQYKLDVLVQDKHKCILNNNPYVTIITKENKINFKYYDHVIYMARSTISENIIALKCFKANKIPLDENLDRWQRIFNNNSHTRAWQLLFDDIFSYSYSYDLPKLFIQNSLKKDSSIIIIGGVTNSNKTIKNISELISYILETFPNNKLIVVGQTNEKIILPNHKNFQNLINKTTYNECISLISNSCLVVGPEGSLIHVSTTLNIPTIIGEYGRQFNKYSDFHSKNITTLDEISVQNIENAMKKYLQSK